MPDLKDIYASVVETKIEKTDCSDQMIEIQVRGQQDVEITPNTFLASESPEFNYDNDIVIFDGSAYLKTIYDINTSTPAEYNNSYISSTTQYIDNSKYKNIVEVSIT